MGTFAQHNAKKGNHEPTTRTDHEMILYLRLAGVTYAEIEDRLGISRAVVYKCVKGKCNHETVLLPWDSEVST